MPDALPRMPQRTPAGQTRHLPLDGLRGVAALAVVFYHAILMLLPGSERITHLLGSTVRSLTGYDAYARFVIALVSGETAVMAFFVISGTVLIKSLEVDAKHNSTWKVFWLFACKRILRIYPALIGCLICMYLIYQSLAMAFPSMYAPFRLQDFLVNMTLYDIRVHGATWTLKAEIIAIPFILLAFLLKKSLGLLGLLLMGAYGAILLDVPAFGYRVYLMPQWAVYFAAGFMANELSKSAFIRDAMSGNKWILVLLGALLFRPIFTLSSHIAILIQVLCITLIVAALAGGMTSGLSRALSGSVSVFLGKISYSLYLWNVIFLNVLLQPALRIDWVKNHYIEAGLLIGVLATVMAIPFSILSERWLEKPFMGLMKRPTQAHPLPTSIPVAVSR